MEGTIKTLTGKGFGFIAREGEAKDLFFHSKELQGVTFEELKLESLAIICTVFDLEADFNIEIPDDAAKNMRSVRDVVEGI